MHSKHDEILFVNNEVIIYIIKKYVMTHNTGLRALLSKTEFCKRLLYYVIKSKPKQNILNECNPYRSIDKSHVVIGSCGG